MTADEVDHVCEDHNCAACCWVRCEMRQLCAAVTCVWANDPVCADACMQCGCDGVCCCLKVGKK